MIETLARGAQIFLAIGIAYLIAVWFALVAWTFRDIEARSRSVFTQVFSTLLVVLFFLPGLLLYLILRPKETLDQAFQRALEEEYLLQDLDDLPLCQGCQRAVDPDFVLCPHCQTRLRGSCPACARLIDLRWSVCPYCAVAVDRSAIEGRGSIDTIRVMDDARAGRRKSAIAAAALRLGIDAEDLDALSDAMAPGAHAAVGAGEGASVTRLPGRERLLQLRRAMPFGGSTPGPNSESIEHATPPIGREITPGSGVSATDSFWSEPLPGNDRAAERTTSVE